MIITLDFETAFGISPSGRKVTLSSMTNEEYIRDPEFKVHGCGLKLGDRPAKYFRGDELEEVFAKIPWEQVYLLQHHAHFDGAILHWHYGHKPKMHLDTLSMARAIYPYESKSLGNMAKVLGLGEKGTELVNTRNKWHLTDQEQQALGQYCATNEDSDLNLTYRLFQALKPHFPVSELRVIDQTVRLFTEPRLEVQTDILLAEYKRERKAKKELIRQCVASKTELSSNDKFAALLLEHGVEPPKKISPAKIKDGRVDPENAGEPPLGILPSFKAPKGASKEERERLKEEKRLYPWAYAFGKSDELFKMLQDHPDERVQALVEARLGVKSTIKETRSKRFYKIGKRGTFPIYLNYYGAHSGRFSGGDKQNAQNLNRVDDKDPASGALRRSLVAPEGHLCVVRDLSQIEARVLAYWAGQTDMIRVFERGDDPYNHMGGQIVGRTIDRKGNPEDKIPGMVGKAATLGCGYQMGWPSFQANLRVGFLGMPGILFGEQEAQKLGVKVYEILGGKSYKQGFATVADEARAIKPLNIDEHDHLVHCAVVKYVVDSYRKANHRVKALWREMQLALDAIIEGEEIECGEHGLVTTCSEGLRLPNGMLIRYHGLKKTKSGDYRYLSNRKKKEWSYIYGGKCVENVTQALARIVLTDQMLEVAPHYPIVTSTHDEMLCVVPKDEAQECLDFMGRVMATPPPWCADLPLKSEGGLAKNYGDCDK